MLRVLAFSAAVLGSASGNLQGSAGLQQGGDFEQYLDNYAKGGAFEGYVSTYGNYNQSIDSFISAGGAAATNFASLENGSSKGRHATSSAEDFDYKKLLTRYIPAEYQGGQTASEQLSAEKCHNMSCLHAWEGSEMATVKKFAGFNKEASNWWGKSVKDRYEKNKARIEHELANLTSVERSAAAGNTSEAKASKDADAPKQEASEKSTASKRAHEVTEASGKAAEPAEGAEGTESLLAAAEVDDSGSPMLAHLLLMAGLAAVAAGVYARVQRRREPEAIEGVDQAHYSLIA